MNAGLVPFEFSGTGNGTVTGSDPGCGGIDMKWNNRGRASRFFMLFILLLALFLGWLYLKKMIATGELKLDPEIVRVIEDPVGAAKENVAAFNAQIQQRMENLKAYE